METWQKEQIARNIYQLVVHTTCTEYLVSALCRNGALSGWDVEQLINQKNDTNGNMGQSLLFYNMILTSTFQKTYSILVAELQKTGQTEAVDILKDGQKNGMLGENQPNILTDAGEDCTIEAVVEEITNSYCARIFVTDWTRLARALRVPSMNVSALRQELLQGRKSHQDVILDILILWRNQKKEEASLNALIGIFRKLMWNEMAERIEKRFGQEMPVNHGKAVDSEKSNELEISES